MRTSETLTKIAPALVAFQSEVVDPRKNSTNPYFKSKYVELDDLMAAVKPIANKHGLYINNNITTELVEGNKMKVWCQTRLTHVSGEWIESDGQFNLAKGTDPQSCGSSQTYIRRYDISAFLGVAWNPDDDGNQGTFGNGKQSPKYADANELDVEPQPPQHPTQKMANDLEILCQKNGRKIQDMLTHYNIKSVAEMDMTTYWRTYNTLKHKLEEAEAQA